MKESCLFTCIGDIGQELDRASISWQPIEGGDGILCLSGRDYPLLVYFPGEWEGPEAVAGLVAQMAGAGIGMAVWKGCGPGQCRGAEEWLQAARRFFSAAARAAEKAGLPEKLVPMGLSGGAAAALDCGLAFQDNVLCLVLESAFVDTWDYLEAAGELNGRPEGAADPFANREKMRRFKPAVLFLQSQMDKEVPPSALEWLVCESRSKASQFQIVPSGGRRDIRESAGPLYTDMIRRFLDLRLGRRPRRHRSWRERG